MKNKIKYLIIISSLFILSCQRNHFQNEVKINNKYNYKINNKRIDKKEKLTPDPELESYLKPYRKKLNKLVLEKISYTHVDLKKENDLLGFFAAQVIFNRAKKYTNLNIDFAVLNRGGLRKPIYKGNITVKDIYELMPFDNFIVVLKIKGSDIKELCENILKKKHTPVYRLNPNSCKINNKRIENEKEYIFSTIDYLYKTKGFPALKKAILLKSLDDKIFRNSIIEYLREHKNINIRKDKNE